MDLERTKKSYGALRCSGAVFFFSALRCRLTLRPEAGKSKFHLDINYLRNAWVFYLGSR